MKNLPDTKDCEQVYHSMHSDALELARMLLEMSNDFLAGNIEKHFEFKQLVDVPKVNKGFVTMNVLAKSTPAVIVNQYNEKKHFLEVYDSPGDDNNCIKSNCPFCDSDDLEVVSDSIMVKHWNVHCRDCCIHGPLAPTPGLAVANWENRTHKRGS